MQQAPVKLAPATTTSRMHTEHMASVIHVDTCYSVPIEMVVDGRPGEVSDQRMYFSILGLRGPSGAPKLVPTHETKHERAALLSVEIQNFDVWRCDDNGHRVTVFCDADPLLDEGA